MEAYNENDYHQGGNQGGDARKSIAGYRIVIIILAVILAALSVLYFSIHHRQKADLELLAGDRDSIRNNLSELMMEFDDLQFTNDTLAVQMGVERLRADSLMQRLSKERSWNLAKVKQYEKEVATLRTIMRGYIRQIDSLNTLNKQLLDENVGYRKEIATAMTRAEMAEEKALELNTKVRQGSVIQARGITLTALNQRGNPVTRVRNAARLRVDFTLTANALAVPGERAVYVCVVAPDGFLLPNETMATFKFEGQEIPFSAVREVDYQNDDLGVGVFYAGKGFEPGRYRIDVYCDGFRVGSSEIALK